MFPERDISRRARLKRGFSILELLIVVAIIGVLMSLSLAAAHRVLTKGRDAIDRQALHEMVRAWRASNANFSGDTIVAARRAECRAAFHQEASTRFFGSMLLYKVKTSADFEAYYHTLLNPRFDEPLDIRGTRLFALNSKGEVVVLEAGISRWVWQYLVRDDDDVEDEVREVYVLDMRHGAGPVVYPGVFPATRSVAVRSLAFLKDFDLSKP